ncbi:MAG: cyclase family protein [Actinobacteria bacterium]|nr:cyclase family protein [Actinomycetota bacterium]MBU1942335.1 cyclase family protein [Actinomycetota bacterium]MBU2686891.1 cyclase family protein [Actinomycetota bacterium]
MAGYRFVDLSVPIEESDSEPFKPVVQHQDHEAGAAIMAAIFGVPAGDLPGGLGWANDNLTLITHAGTHLDAPWHYAPTAGGERAITIDEVPLDWCFSDGVVLDMRHKETGERIEVEDIVFELERIDYQVKPMDIVLIMTGVDRHWGSPDYINRGAGMTAASTLWLIEKGVRVMGIDAWGFDRPFVKIREEYEAAGDASIIWEAHYAGIREPYCHLEKLANLDRLPPHGFTVSCFPVKITGASAAWCRPVGIIEE